MPSFKHLTSLTTVALGLQRAAARCQVYGIDFVNGGSYFQNNASTDPFTAVEEFSGCENDTANNILVAPNGDQTQCSDANLTPDYTDRLVTCDGVTKNEMFSGEWSLVVISNNGDADPIAYQRDFSLTVGPQMTTTFTPTVIATDIETPVSTINQTTTSTLTTTLVASTTTVHELIALPKPTLTSIPLPHVSIVTKVIGTVTQTQNIPHVLVSTATAQASCAAPSPNLRPDPVASIVITVVKTEAKIVSGFFGSSKFRRGLESEQADVAELKRQFVAERHARLSSEADKLAKRVPDAATVTATETDSASFVTTTSTSYAAATSVTLTNTEFVTLAKTPAVVTITQALLDLGKLITVVEDLLTIRATVQSVATTTVSKSVPWTVTVTSTTTPAELAAKCSSTGGSLA